MEKIEIHIDGMHCSGCAIGVQMATLSLDGVRSSFIDLDTKLGTIEYDSAKIKPESIVEEIEKLGYTANIAPHTIHN